jgi:hypothetical protein
VPFPAEREERFLEFFRGAYRDHNFRSDQALFIARCQEVGRYATLYDEDLADEKGAQEETERIRSEWGSSHFDPKRGWVHNSLVQYDLGQCRRASCSSHVEDGGGVALEPDSLKCERAVGPSHVEEGGGDALQRISREMDRSSPDTDGPASLSGSGVGSGSITALGSTGTCVACGHPPQT